MNDLRTKLIRLAHEKPELRAQLLPLIKEAKAGKKLKGKKLDNHINSTFNRLGNRIQIRMLDIPMIWDKSQSAYESGETAEEADDLMEKAMIVAIQKAKVASAQSKVAHKPHIREINRNTNRDGLSSMIYHIDAEENKSKFHEMHVDGTTLKRVWGALTDRGGFGRTQSKSESFSSPEQAMSQMQKIKASKVRKGYIDAYGRFHRTPDGKALPQGQYPVGLTRNVGFGWGTQESAFCIPELKRLQEDLTKHQSILSRTLPSSDMGKKILGQIKTLTRYLDKQMSLCG